MGNPSTTPLRTEADERRNADALTIYMRLLPNEFFEELVKNYGLQRNNSVYTDRVVLYLMVSQRLRANGTLQTGVNQLIRGLPQDFWPRPCKRLSTEGLQRPMSSNTGSYNKGRQRLPVIIVEACYDRIYKRLIEQTESLVAGKGRRGYLLDGTTLRTPHTATLKETYPPASNQHGESHWPLLRMVVAHDLHTGLAMRPQWGSQAVSEQKLLEQCIDRIPAEGILVADANFGVFSVAYAAHVRRRAMVLRLERNRAQRICPEPLRDGLQVPICWKPSRAECKKHHLPADAGVPGWIVVRQIRRKPDGKPFLLLLFTTVDWPAEEIIAWYGQRWNIEVDLRTLKSTLQIGQLTTTTIDMVAKEIDVAMMTYNLVRAVTCVAAERQGVPPRSYSFSRVRSIVETFAPLIAAAKDPEEAQAQTDRMMHYVAQCKLYPRTRPTYPRAVWDTPRVFPKRKPNK